MCGVAGLILPQSEKSGLQKAIPKMLESLQKRGPDGQGSQTFESEDWLVGLAHRRLSIIDIEGGPQPFEVDTSAITYNGEVFNFLELRSDLEKQGHNFKSHSDTEVALRLFIEEKQNAFHRFNGMFALGIWDQMTKSLTLARDSVGIKPLYYAPLLSGGLVFGSDLLTVVRSGFVPVRISRLAVENYFFSEYCHSPHTMIEGVYKLPPGHYLTWQNGKLSGPIDYRRPVTPKVPNNFKAAFVDFENRFEKAVARQLIADVPVGVLLSGGLDSSSVVAAANAQTRHRLQTFSVEFDDPQFNEGPLARRISEQFKTQHRVLKLEDYVLLENIDRALDSLDEPMADPSVLPTFLLCEMVSEHVKVALGGDGGDELFGGYPTYKAHQWAQFYQKLPAWAHQKCVHPLVMSLPSSARRWSLDWKLKRFFGRWDASPVLRHLRWMAGTDLFLVGELFGHSLTPWSFQDLKASKNSDSLNAIMEMDFKSYLPSEVLVKVDRTSMAHGLEVRPPFLDAEMIQFAQALPSKMKVGADSKLMVRAYVDKHVGSWISKVPKKGFGIPLNSWMKRSLKSRIDRALFESPVFAHTHLKVDVLTKLWGEHQSGSQDHSRTFWSFLVLDHWLKRILREFPLS